MQSSNGLENTPKTLPKKHSQIVFLWVWLAKSKQLKLGCEKHVWNFSRAPLYTMMRDHDHPNIQNSQNTSQDPAMEIEISLM
jgi:hypothetical protein